MCKVSVVVPVYNAENYLKECIESLIGQSFEDIEIVLVDDGSKDLSGAICDEYAKKDERIKTFHKKNEGASVARKFGIEKTKGEFIAFVDSDDYVEKEFIKELYKSITENDADLAECDYNTFSQTFSRRKELYNRNLILDKDEFLDKVVKGTIINGDVAVVVWNKLYKKQLIEKLVSDFGESLLEDYIFNIQYYRGVEKYVYVNKPLINYRQLQGSLSRRHNHKTYSILKDVLKIKQEFMNETGLNDSECIEQANQWYLKYVYNYLKNLFVMNNGLTVVEKQAEALKILRDNQLYETCQILQSKNKFAVNIIEKDYKKIIINYKMISLKIRIMNRLSKVKRTLMRRK